MKIITPFPIPNELRFELEIPPDAEILAVTVHNGIPQMWIIHEQSDIVIWRIFRLVPGGSFIPVLDNMKYVDHFKTKDNAIFIFEEI